MAETISINQARKIVLANQNLRVKTNDKFLLDIIKKIHNIQIDTISVVARSQDWILFNRLAQYKEKEIWKLEKQKKIFESFSHQLCFLPIEEYPFYLWIIDHMRKNPGKWTINWIKDNQKIVDYVYNHIKASGSTCSSDFKKATKVKREGWWVLKAENLALKHLFHTGKLLISHRKGFQRYYDLPERVIPPHISSEPLEKEEMPLHTLKIIFNALGIVSVSEIRNYLGNTVPKILWGNKKEAIEEFLEENLKNGLITQVMVEGIKDKHYVMEKEYENLIKTSNDNIDEFPIKLLSPFDNVIRDRYFPKKLWNFNYTFEAYIPKAKRTYGFYLLPILDNYNLVGNIDAKVYRKEKVLEIISLYLEKDLDNNLLNRLLEGLVNFAKFNSCNKINLSKTYPQNIEAKLNSELRDIMESTL